MPSAVSPQWQEKASDFFQTSGISIKFCVFQLFLYVYSFSRCFYIGIEGHTQLLINRGQA